MNSVEEKVIKILRRFSAYYQFPLNSKLTMDLRLNEWSLVSLTTKLEKEFDITLPDDRFLDILLYQRDMSVQEVIDIVKHELIKVNSSCYGGI